MSKEYYEKTICWLRSGKIGCSFAVALARKPEDIGWRFQINPKELRWTPNTFLLTLVFPDKDIHSVKEWALKNGMYIEDLDGLYEGLRLKIGGDISWVQYFGPDSHVLTRQSPYPMLNLCVKLDKWSYAKVGFKGVLHLAHAPIKYINRLYWDKLWDLSFINTEKRLGHKPTIREAAKTTYIK